MRWTNAPLQTRVGRALAMGAAAVAICGVYLAINHLVPPRLSTRTPIDDLVPFQPWAVWIYSTLYPGFLVVGWTIDERRCRRLLEQLAAVCAGAFACFILVQTESPRLDPLPELDGVTGFLYATLTFLDRPSNACPSLHVAFVALFASQFGRDEPGRRLGWRLWAVAVVLSTIAVRQHTAVDAVGGLVLAAAVRRLIPDDFPIAAPRAPS